MFYYEITACKPLCVTAGCHIKYTQILDVVLNFRVLKSHAV